MNLTSSSENLMIKCEHENNKSQKVINSLNLSLASSKNIEDNDDDIIWIFDKYNEQKIDDNVFIDLTNDDQLNLLLNSSNLDLFPTPTQVTQAPNASSQGIYVNEVKNEARCISQTQNLKCEYCQKTFKKQFNFKRHLVIHKNEYPYSCSFCNQKFKDASNSRKHLKYCKMKVNMNGETGDEEDSLTLSSNRIKKKKITRILKCDICDKQFLKKYNLTRHLNMHKLNDYNFGEFSDDDEGNNENRDIMYYECKICNKKFNESKQLNLHHTNYHVERSEMVCNFCNEKFTLKYNFLLHELECKEKNSKTVKFFTCSICKKNFSKIYNLNRHLATRHENKTKNERFLKKFKCEFCSKAFYECNKLKIHVNNCKFGLT